MPRVRVDQMLSSDVDTSALRADLRDNGFEVVDVIHKGIMNAGGPDVLRLILENAEHLPDLIAIIRRWRPRIRRRPNRPEPRQVEVVIYGAQNHAVLSRQYRDADAYDAEAKSNTQVNWSVRRAQSSPTPLSITFDPTVRATI